MNLEPLVIFLRAAMVDMNLGLDPVLLTQRLIQYNTVNPTGDELSCLRFLAELLEAYGFATTISSAGDTCFSLTAQSDSASSAPAFVLGGHIDTVPLGEQGWESAPFEGVVASGKLYGRGSSDMKSGIGAMVCAGIKLARAASGSGKNITLHIFGGEETGCKGSFHTISCPELRGNPDVVIVTEPSNNLPLIGHKGALWLRCTARGKTAHASMPEQGDNALLKALQGITAVTQFSFGELSHEYMGKPTLVLSTFQGGLNINSVPDKAVFTLDIRPVIGQDIAQIAEEIDAAVGEEIDVEVLLEIPPVWTPPEHPWVQAVVASVCAERGKEWQTRTVQFFTDAAAYRKYLPNVPIIILGPGDPALAHQTDEYCDVQAIEQAALLYEQIGMQWLQGNA